MVKRLKVGAARQSTAANKSGSNKSVLAADAARAAVSARLLAPLVDTTAAAGAAAAVLARVRCRSLSALRSMAGLLVEGMLGWDLDRKLVSFFFCWLSYSFTRESARPSGPSPDVSLCVTAVCLSLSPADIDLHLESGRVLLSEGKYGEALAHYEAAIEADRKNYLTFFKRATVLLALGRHRAALDDLSDVVALKPDFVAARSQRGVLLFKMGRLDEAHIDLEWVLRSDPYNEEANHYYNLIHAVKQNIEAAHSLLEDGQAAEAAGLLTQVMVDVPWDVALREMRAVASERAGDLAAAISDLRVTTKMRSDDTSGILRMSLLHYRLGEAEESLVTIRECLKLDQDHKDCLAHYKRIKKLALLMANMNALSTSGSYAECVEKADAVLKLDSNAAIVQLAKAKKCHCQSKVSPPSPGIVRLSTDTCCALRHRRRTATLQPPSPLAARF